MTIAEAYNPSNTYTNYNEEMVKIVPITEPGNAANATEEYGPFSDTFIKDRGNVWDIIPPLLHVTDACTHVNSNMRNHDGWKAIIEFYDHFLGPNNMNHLQKQAEMKLQNLTYAGEIKNWNFERFLTDHKEQNTIIEGLNKHGYNGWDNRTNVTRLMDGVKVDSINTAKAMIITNSGFCKEFDKCVTLYKDFLKHSDSNQSDTRRVLEVSSGRRGVSGVKKVEYCYYTKDKYSKLYSD